MSASDGVVSLVLMVMWRSVITFLMIGGSLLMNYVVVPWEGDPLQRPYCFTMASVAAQVFSRQVAPEHGARNTRGFMRCQQ